MIDIVCGKCGSKNVRRDADLLWSVEKQEWEVAGIYDYNVCDDCGAEDEAEEVELPPVKEND